MKSIDTLIDDLKKSYEWNISTAESLAAQKRLNRSEITTILTRLGKAEMCASIIDGESNNNEVADDLKTRQSIIMLNMNMNREDAASDIIKVNRDELKKVFAYLNIDDLVYTMKSDIDYLESHNKNYTKGQYNRIDTLKTIIEKMEA